MQRTLRELQKEWWTNFTVRTQLCADSDDYKGFYEALKALYGPRHQVQNPLRSTDAQALLKDRESILQRWSEHFRVIFSVNRTIQDDALLRIPQHPVKAVLDEAPIKLKKSPKPSATEEWHVPESQGRFRANRDVTDMVFVLRQLQDKYCENRTKV